MNPVLAFDIVILALVLLAVGYWIYNKIMLAISPRYAAKRKLKEQERSDRAYQKRQQRRAAKEARLLVWAKENPDDPFARQLAAQNTATASTDAKFDPLAELQRRQREADELAQRLKDRQEAEEMRSLELLKWALANPTAPEARRHLEEMLNEASKRLERAIRDVDFEQRYGVKNDGPEAIEAATRLAEAEARKQAEERQIREIQAALTLSPSDSEQ